VTVVDVAEDLIQLIKDVMHPFGMKESHDLLGSESRPWACTFSPSPQISPTEMFIPFVPAMGSTVIFIHTDSVL
jgi:hypothetical protein